MKLIDKYHTFLFDLDGTLTNTGMVWLGIWRDCLADFGVIGLSDHTIAEHTHDWAESIKLGVPASELEAFAQAAYRRADERLAHAPLHSGTQRMLETLERANKHIGIVSAMDRPIFAPAIARHQLERYTDVLIAGTDVANRKPHPEAIHTALGKLGVPRDAYAGVVYIGDKGTDVQTAQSAGVDGILYFPALHHELYDQAVLLQSNPTAVIGDWRELYS